jgi:hypothetical protein
MNNTDPNDIWLKIIKNMEGRRQKGWETYGKPLTSDDGRNWFREVKEELLDAVAYSVAGEELLDALTLRLSELEEENVSLKEEIKTLKINTETAHNLLRDLTDAVEHNK